jgi:hypothetical protein
VSSHLKKEGGINIETRYLLLYNDVKFFHVRSDGMVVVEVIGYILLILGVISWIQRKKKPDKKGSYVLMIIGIVFVLLGSLNHMPSATSATSSTPPKLSTDQQNNVDQISKQYSTLKDDVQRMNDHKGDTAPISFFMVDLVTANDLAESLAANIKPPLADSDQAIVKGNTIDPNKAYRSLLYNFRLMTESYLNAFSSSGIKNKLAFDQGQLAYNAVALDLKLLGKNP